jgi:hypothetical protein
VACCGFLSSAKQKRHTPSNENRTQKKEAAVYDYLLPRRFAQNL